MVFKEVWGTESPSGLGKMTAVWAMELGNQEGIGDLGKKAKGVGAEAWLEWLRYSQQKWGFTGAERRSEVAAQVRGIFFFLIDGIAVCFRTCVHSKSLQSSPTLCDLMDCSPPGSSIHGIPQAGVLEWVAMPFSRRIFPTQESNPHL